MISRRFRENIRNVWNYIDICIYFFSKEFVQFKKKGGGEYFKKNNPRRNPTQVSRSSLSKTEAATHSLSTSLRMQLVKPNVRPCKKKAASFFHPGEKKPLPPPLSLFLLGKKKGKEKSNSRTNSAGDDKFRTIKYRRVQFL